MRLNSEVLQCRSPKINSLECRQYLNVAQYVRHYIIPQFPGTQDIDPQLLPPERFIEDYMRQNMAMSKCEAPVYLSGNNLTARLVCYTKPPKPDKHDETKAIDIIAVHGLSPWESFAGSPFWLYDFIAKDIRGARVFTFDYDAKAVWLYGAPLQSIQDASSALLGEIAAIREEAPLARPLVFICHGFGSFIVESVSLCFNPCAPSMVVLYG
jgi:hypothetical protein